MTSFYEDLAKTNEKPVLVFLKHYDSHNFADRTIIINDEVKIGRAVARLKSTTNNAIFDCKVLSRNHAIISYIDKKFILKDTKSSNGTFVNNVRVNKEDSEYGEKEIFSNDIVKFGVEVLEHGTTHGCIVTQIKLYHPNGMEAIQGKVFEPKVTNDVSMKLSSEKFFKLENYVIDAMYREGNLRNRISELKTVINDINESSRTVWKAMLNEELLLDKINLYETELRVFREIIPEDSLKFKVSELLHQISENQALYKTNLEKYINEKDHLKCVTVDWQKKCEIFNQDNIKLKNEIHLSQESYKNLLIKMDDRSKELEQANSELIDESNKRIEVEKKLTDSAQEITSLKMKQEVKDENLPHNGLNNGIDVKKESEDSPYNPANNLSVDHIEVVNSTKSFVESTPQMLNDSRSQIKNEFSNQEPVVHSSDENNSSEFLHNGFPNMKSFQDEYKLLVERLELIERELSICKKDQAKAKTENLQLKNNMETSENEITKYRMKCSSLESQLEEMSKEKGIKRETSQNSESQLITSDTQTITTTTSREDSPLISNSQLNLAYNIFLIPLMVFLLGIIWSIFSYFSPR